MPAEGHIDSVKVYPFALPLEGIKRLSDGEHHLVVVAKRGGTYVLYIDEMRFERPID